MFDEPYPEAFEAFWLAYPPRRRTGKRRALAAWKRASGKTSAETLEQRARDYASSDVGKSDFCKGPEPWLNGECWLDAPEAWRRNGDRPDNDPRGNAAVLKQYLEAKGHGK